MKSSSLQAINTCNIKVNLSNNFRNIFYIAECDFGKGLFSKIDIRKEENIFNFTGKLITFKQTLEATDNFGDPLQIGKDLYINLEEPMRFINHSCNPNTGIINDVTLIALRDIQAGEELYFDYSTSIDEDYWVMQCMCGEANCRKTIKDFKYLPVQAKQKYLNLNIVQKFIAVQYQKIATNV
ncbi:MAG: SET domain-containing protein [Gloeocapsa sp. UFS-A4-WI-NPMV-4B04]|jgi:hypothetical protein|nr:SET domain-containing protein [Gloeocapsa sp. UFS-A4-WI-NPMV-4B04]